ncbi:unnamed protein product [Calypogeia fissa]
MRIVSRKVLSVKGGTPANEHKVMYLSGPDHFVRPRHVPILLFYGQVGGKPVLPTEVLLSSLKQTLLHYPPLSGRLRRKANSTSKFELVCNDAGAEFVEATVDGTLADFGDFQPNRLFTELLDPVPVVLDDICEHPVLYAQVTRFACGGAALVASSIHTVTDGLSVNKFITSWSELARGVELSNPPVHNRTLLKSTKAPDPNFKPKELRPIGNIATVAPNRDVSTWPTQRMFTFSAEQLKKVKTKASKDGVACFSTFESINGHVWQSVTKARCLDPTSNTKFLTTLDARNRVKPNLPAGFFGNAICFVSSTTTAGEIVKQPLSYAAGLIRDAISGFSEDYMRSLFAFVENFDGPVALNVNSGVDAGHDISIASWVRMQFHEADFGCGKPLIAGPGNNPYDGNVIMLPGINIGDINVYISLEPADMLRLEEDPEFLLEI